MTQFAFMRSPGAEHDMKSATQWKYFVTTKKAATVFAAG